MTDVLALRGIVSELVEAGVTEVVVCPGSRSTPLALAAKAHPGLRVRVLLDERSAGYFALGMARASRRPVAVIVTSGTAVANLLPVGRRGVARARAAGPAHRRSPARAARSRRPPDDRPGPHLRRLTSAGSPSCRCSTARPRRDGTSDRWWARAVAHGACRSGRAGPSQRPVPRAARPGRRARPTRRRGRGRMDLARVHRRRRRPLRARARTTSPDLAGRLATIGARSHRRGTLGRPGPVRPPSPDWPRRPAIRSPPTHCRASAAGRTIGRSSCRTPTISSDPAPGATSTCPSS